MVGMLVAVGVLPALVERAKQAGNAVTPTSGVGKLKQAMRNSFRGAGMQLSKMKSKNTWEIQFSELNIGRKIAAGSFGTVHLGTWLSQRVAIKMPTDNVGDDALEDFIDEVTLMSTIHHPNIGTRTSMFGFSSIGTPFVCLTFHFPPLFFSQWYFSVPVSNARTFVWSWST